MTKTADAEGLREGEPVPIVQAFAWTCPGCGERNYVEAVDVDISEEELRGLCLRLEIIESWQPTPPASQFVTAPSNVECAECSVKYAAFDLEGAAGDDDDED